MASPIGHSLAGLAVGLTLAPRTGRAWAPLAAAVLLANVPDLDFVPVLAAGPGRASAWHHSVTHTLLFAALASLAIWLVPAYRRRLGSGRGLALALLALTSHLAIDWWTSDTRPPMGLELLWPASDRLFIAARPLFAGIRRGSPALIFGAANWTAGLVEFVLLAPAVLAAAAVRELATAGRHGRSRGPAEARV